MTTHEIAGNTQFNTVVLEEDREVSSVFCCDLLSLAMSRAREDSAWVTVMGNKNVIAVAALTDVACVVIAEGYSFDEDAVEAAKGKVTLLSSQLPVFETAKMIDSMK